MLIVIDVDVSLFGKRNANVECVFMLDFSNSAELRSINSKTNREAKVMTRFGFPKPQTRSPPPAREPRPARAAEAPAPPPA